MDHRYCCPLTGRERETEERAWLTLSQTAGLSLKQLWKAIDMFGSATETLDRLEHGALSVPAKNCELPSDRGAAILKKSASLGHRLLTPASPEYPLSLLDLAQPPATLYVSGTHPINAPNHIAIVGSRLATPYGLSQAASLARSLAQRRITVISGLARGIDAQAHRGALKGAGHTIAVIGCGLDIAYPRENAALQQRIAQEGNIISEYAYGTPPLAYHFPARNRLIAALSLGTIIVQASAHSGALITANIANDLGREVMVVPGALDINQSQGCLQLLLEGASPVRHVTDIFDVLHIFADPPDAAEEGSELPLSASAQAVMSELTSQGATVDELAARTRLGTGLVAAILSQLRVFGLAQRLPEAVWIPI